MFTGIIEAVGRVSAVSPTGGDIRLSVDVGELDMSDVKLGDSIAVNGVCLTAIEFDAHSFVADVSNETISLTSLKQLAAGSEVNLEKALTPQTRLGGHLVSGHVDGLGEVVSMHEDARSVRLGIRAPEELKRYIAAKGSITVDGTSLTVNDIDDREFGLNIVPHTQQRTIIKNYSVGQQVNLEVDLVARYLERLLLNLDEAQASSIDMNMLHRAGFIK